MYVLDDELILADIKSNAIKSTIYVLNSTWTKVSNIPENSICSEPLDCELVVTKSNYLKTFYLFRESFVNFFINLLFIIQENGCVIIYSEQTSTWLGMRKTNEKIF